MHEKATHPGSYVSGDDEKRPRDGRKSPTERRREPSLIRALSLKSGALAGITLLLLARISSAISEQTSDRLASRICAIEQKHHTLRRAQINSLSLAPAPPLSALARSINRRCAIEFRARFIDSPAKRGEKRAGITGDTRQKQRHRVKMRELIRLSTLSVVSSPSFGRAPK